MKKLFFMLVAVSFALSFAPAAQAETKAGPANPAGTAKKAEGKKAKSHQITGVVEAVDDKAGTLTVKGRRESVSLTVTDEGKLEKVHVGDKVLVNYTGETASRVKKVSKKKASPKKTAKKNASPKTAVPVDPETVTTAAEALAEKK